MILLHKDVSPTLSFLSLLTMTLTSITLFTSITYCDCYTKSRFTPILSCIYVIIIIHELIKFI